ncbi:hypothetical protein [Falsiroseomonas selenitidurans]|uniref:Uncharacterized protein n=1 Tax=Falsiroseomonas selenitidurans TaxID=2716335 RepID=A0ABX1EA32_9PROT|nr:hypothetical protein [Falsiroseomonas selenitidurans]NKC33881.1 hypothetical protein [Falsiroseomonas selenitidurans]
MIGSLRGALGAALVVGLAGAAISTTALAQSYPRVTCSGMNCDIDYGPMGSSNVVGGGRVLVSSPNGMDVNIMHLDAMFAQRPRDGFIPLTVGSGENQEIVWVPSTMLEMVRRAREGAEAR